MRQPPLEARADKHRLPQGRSRDKQHAVSQCNAIAVGLYPWFEPSFRIIAAIQ